MSDNESVWTIDIAYILHGLGLRVEFVTQTLGVQDAYVTEAFYQSAYHADKARVNRQFAEAASRGLKVEKRELSLEELCDHIAAHGPAVVLVNSRLLNCITCWRGRGMQLAGCCVSSEYTGHFVVACGFDGDRKHVFYKDPSVSHETCCVPRAMFEEARHAFGTDDDIVLVYGV